jgi:DNA-binding CsgD family transcriptional regulator
MRTVVALNHPAWNVRMSQHEYLAEFRLPDGYIVISGPNPVAMGFRMTELQQCITAPVSGDAGLAPSATRRLLGRFVPLLPGPERTSRRERIIQALTGRERDVFRLLARGQSNREIASGLHLSESTIKIHVGHILAKLGLRDRVQAVVEAYESGLITPEGDLTRRTAGHQTSPIFERGDPAGQGQLRLRLDGRWVSSR